MKKIQIVIIVAILLLFINNAVAYPPTPHLEDPIPARGELDVDLSNPKGVQTCINVTLDPGCEVNLTFQWYNYTGGDAGQWQTYGYSENANTSGQYCFWNTNVTCATENWWSTWFHWRVMANFTCQQTDYQEIYYTYFNPEDCPLFYIYPPWNETDLCPCCIPLCVSVQSFNGSTMNITFWSNLSMGFWDYFWIGADKNVTFSNITNGTYCFNVCPFNRYNYTYYWNVSINDGHAIENYGPYSFTTEENMSECIGGYNLSELRSDAAEKDYIIGLIGIIGVLGIMGWLFNRRRRKNEEE